MPSSKAAIFTDKIMDLYPDLCKEDVGLAVIITSMSGSLEAKFNNFPEGFDFRNSIPGAVNEFAPGADKDLKDKAIAKMQAIYDECFPSR